MGVGISYGWLVAEDIGKVRVFFMELKCVATRPIEEAWGGVSTLMRAKLNMGRRLVIKIRQSSSHIKRIFQLRNLVVVTGWTTLRG